MALFRKFFYRKPPDGLLEISERVYVFDCCFSTDVLEDEEYKIHMGGIVAQLREQFPDASFMVFNFREGENRSQISNILSEYDMTVMDYPRQYEGCPLLTMEMIHHFLRSSESWLCLGQQNLLLMHCERGGWPVLAFMLAALLIYRKQYTGEQKTLDMIYKQAPCELLQFLSPLNPLPSQIRYLQYVCRRNVGSEWPPLDRALTLDCVILRMVPNFDGEGGCRPIFRIYGQDPFIGSDRTPKVLFSTPKKSKIVQSYKLADCELVKIDIHCHIQGDVVLECISIEEDLEREIMMFRVMFNTAFIRSNILMVNQDEIDILWDAKDRFPKDFRAEVLLSEMDATTSPITKELVNVEDKEGLPVEAFAKVQEIFSSVDWFDGKGYASLHMPDKVKTSNTFLESIECDSARKEDADTTQQKACRVVKEKMQFDVLTDEISKSSVLPPKHLVSMELSDSDKYIEPHDLQVALSHLSQPKIEECMPASALSSSISSSNSLHGPPLPLSKYHSAPSVLSTTAMLHDHAAFGSSEISRFAISSSDTSLSTAIVTDSREDGLKISLLDPSSISSPSTITSQKFPVAPSAITISPTITSPQIMISRQIVAPPPPPLPPAITSQKFLLAPPTTTTTTNITNSQTKISMKNLVLPAAPPLPPSSVSMTSPSPSSTLSHDLSTSRLVTSLTSHHTSQYEQTSSKPTKFAPPPPPLPPPHVEALPSSIFSGPGKDTKIYTPSAPPPSPPPAASQTPAPLFPLLKNIVVTTEGAPPPPPPLHSRPTQTAIKSSVPPPPPPPHLSSKQICSPPKSQNIPPPPPPKAPSGVVSSRSNTTGSVSCAEVKGRSLMHSASHRSMQSSSKKTNLKPLHWVKVTRAMQGSLWAETQKADEAAKAPEFDMIELESLFSAAVLNSEHMDSADKSNRRASRGQKSEKVHLIDLRRANNCEIMLTKITIPLPDLMSTVLALDDSVVDADQVDNLIKFCPTKDEMELLKNYSGDKECLGKCEQFLLELMKVPRVESKLRVFSFKIQFRAQVADLRNNLNIVNSAAEEVRNSSKLKRIMQAILTLGNALNQGTARGSAIGFRLDSLLKLTDTRARNNKMTLMHYLCKVLAEKSPDLLFFPKDLISLEAASKIQLKSLAEEMQAISKGLEKVMQELTSSENDGPVSQTFQKTLKEFLVVAEADVRDLTSLYSGVGRNADELALYFGEDPVRCPFEQVASTLFNFLKIFIRSHEENCKQLELEKKRTQKEVQNEKLKLKASKKEQDTMLGSPLKNYNSK